MSNSNFLSRIRRLDNMIARWVMRHFYFIFFQVILVIIFVFWLSNTVQIIDINFQISKNNLLEKILLTQSINTSIIVILLLLNSFWMLYILGGIQRLRNLLRDISYNIGKLRNKNF